MDVITCGTIHRTPRDWHKFYPLWSSANLRVSILSNRFLSYFYYVFLLCRLSQSGGSTLSIGNPPSTSPFRLRVPSEQSQNRPSLPSKIRNYRQKRYLILYSTKRTRPLPQNFLSILSHLVSPLRHFLPPVWRFPTRSPDIRSDGPKVST